MSKSLEYQIFPPLVGAMLNLDEVPDPVFAGKYVGDGIAIDPIENKIYAPIDGVVQLVHKSKHAITILHDAGFSLLIHIGLDTVNLNGVGFDINVGIGDRVARGQLLGEFDLDYVSQVAKALISPVLLLDMDSDNPKYTLNVYWQDYTSLDAPIMQLVDIQKNI